MCDDDFRFDFEENDTRLDLRDQRIYGFPQKVLAFEKLTALNLSAYNVVNKHSIEMSEEYWWEVSLDNNNIPEVSDTIRLLHNLEELYLNQVNMEKLSDRIGDLEKLRVLSLRNNNLQAIPASIGNLKNLEYLDLSFNRIKEIPPQIGGCENLRVLNVGSNALKTIPPEVGNLSKLEVLDFSNYNQEKVWDDTVERFQLQRNCIKKLPPETADLTDLEDLYYDGNPLIEPALWFLDDGYLPSAWFSRKK